MGRIVSNFFIALDGVVESPDQWHYSYFNDEMGAAISKGAAACGAFLMGRKLYDEWSGYWPAHDGDAADEFGGFINAIPKYVVSTTLRDPAWRNTTVVSGDVAGQLRALKEQVDGDIGMSGSGTLVRWLLANNLVDELNLMLHPVAVGHGARLFGEGVEVPLRLARNETLSTGVVWLTYEPAGG